MLLRKVARVRGLQNYAPRGVIVDEKKRVIALAVAAGRNLKAATKPRAGALPGLPVLPRGSYQIPVKYLYAGGAKVQKRDKRAPLVESHRYHAEYLQRLYFDVGAFLKSRPPVRKAVNEVKRSSRGARAKSAALAKVLRAQVYPKLITARAHKVLVPSLDRLPTRRTPCRLLRAGCSKNPFCAVQNRKCYIRKLPRTHMNRVHKKLVHAILSSRKVTGQQVNAHMLLRGGVRPHEIVLRRKRDINAFRRKYLRKTSSKTRRRRRA